MRRASSCSSPKAPLAPPTWGNTAEKLRGNQGKGVLTGWLLEGEGEEIEMMTFHLGGKKQDVLHRGWVEGWKAGWVGG